VNINDQLSDRDLATIYKALDFYGDHVQAIEAHVTELTSTGLTVVGVLQNDTNRVRRLANQIDEIRLAAKRAN
jgi:hypothetical protein